MRGIFGWDLPPGCSHRDIETAFEDRPCEVCCKSTDNCVCPECPKCKTQGDPNCYKKHGLKKTKAKEGYSCSSKALFLKT